MRADNCVANGRDPTCSKSHNTSFDFCHLKSSSMWVNGKKYKETGARWLLIHDPLSAVAVQMFLKSSWQEFL